ncbi:MAG: CBS domain-containing protein, partial [Sphingopyxis sp.]
ADGVVVGIFSERDVIHGLTNEGAAALTRTIGEVMTSPVIGIESDASALAALSLMTRRRIRHLPVIDGETLVGFVSIGDLVKHRIEAIEAEAAAMRDYISGA